MGWDLDVPWQRKQWEKENKQRAARMADMPLEDWATGYTEDEINKILRAGTQRTAGVPKAPAVPDWLKQPWMNVWPTPPGQYGRWGSQQDWSWYAPQAQVADQPHLAVINRLLPYLSPEDREVMARQLYIAGGGTAGPFASYLSATAAGATPAAPQGAVVQPFGQAPASGWLSAIRGTAAPAAKTGTYEDVLKSIEGVLENIPDNTAKAWAQSVFRAYRDYTPTTGMRGAEEEAVLKARLDELFASVPESAEPYAAAMQRLVQPSVRRPEYEWYELRAPQRTAPTNWSTAGNLRWNPAWM